LAKGEWERRGRLHSWYLVFGPWFELGNAKYEEEVLPVKLWRLFTTYEVHASHGTT